MGAGMTMDPFKPVPWDDFTPIPAPKKHRAPLTLRVFAIACAVFIICGALAAFNH